MPTTKKAETPEVLDKNMIDTLMPEKDFLATVVEMADAYGWLVHHVLEQRHFAKRIGPGFPDLVLVSVAPMRPRIIFAELKREKALPTHTQMVWLQALGRCIERSTTKPSPVEVYVFWPSNLEIIDDILSGKAG